MALSTISSYDNGKFGTPAFLFVTFNGPKALNIRRIVMGNASKGLVRYRLNEFFWQNQTALVFFRSFESLLTALIPLAF